MVSRFAFLGMIAVAAMTLLIWAAAYVSFNIFRNEIALTEKAMATSTPPLARAASAITTDVANIYKGARIIVVCSQLEETQKSGSGCP